MGLKDNTIAADDKAFEANNGDVGAKGGSYERAKSGANNGTRDGANDRTNGGVTGGTFGKSNRGFGGDDKAFEARNGNARANEGGNPNGAYEASDDEEGVAQYISHSVTLDDPGTARRRREAPPLVRDLSHEERARLERALVRKIDLRLLPMIILMYILNYLDRNNIASARLAGLETDLRLVGTQYQTCVSILFVGYLLMQGMVFLPGACGECELELMRDSAV